MPNSVSSSMALQTSTGLLLERLPNTSGSVVLFHSRAAMNFPSRSVSVTQQGMNSLYVKSDG
jgi:hypothetical protein